MGGDGGVVATNRKYMRGAGTADHTGDYNKDGGSGNVYNAREAMTTCALTKTPLLTTAGSTMNNMNNKNTIVADLYGRLYHKEAAVLALLERKQQQDSSASSAAVGGGGGGDSNNNSLGRHVRRLSDLYNVRFHTDISPTSSSSSSSSSMVTITCPITGKELNGNIPAILLVPGKPDTPNVVSEGALKQLSRDELEEEYGPISRQIRLAPPPTLLKAMQDDVRIEQEREEKDRKDAKRIKHGGGGGNKKKRQKLEGESTSTEAALSSRSGRTTKTSSNSDNKGTTVGQQVQSRVDSAIQNNAVLSSLFVNKDTTSRKISDKEHRDNLFAR